MSATEPATKSVFRSPEAERRVIARYDGFVERWPVEVVEADVDSTWGSVHVLSWGPAEGPPLLLCHAASMAAISWLPNAGTLAETGHRCHAVDYLGEANRSRLADVDRFPRSGAELADLYAGVMDDLGIERAPVVSASAGSHVALRLALEAPARVSRLALLGPMSITPLGIGSMLRMMLASFVPRPSVTERTSRWALGTAPAVTEAYGSWFSTVLGSVASPPRVARPVALEPDELARIEVPVLLVLGDRDPLVGDPARAAKRASALPDVRIETLGSSHLVAVERAAEVNALLADFLATGSDR